MSNRRRTFLKMLAASPLMGCSGNYSTYGDTGGSSSSGGSSDSAGTGGASGTSGSSGAGGSRVSMPGGEPAGNVNTV
ncbi:MAG TPA: hypothetical protein VIK01_10890, partial [Polyangiaceae bacterium]